MDKTTQFHAEIIWIFFKMNMLSTILRILAGPLI
jgi:hypothetical protein